jgi:hypothetical protein
MSPSSANWPDRWQESHGDRSRKSGGLSSYDRIMSYTTDAFIQYWNLQKELLGECFMGTHLDGWNNIPDNIGATVSVDSLAFASPSFFQSYYKPYLDRISDAFSASSSTPAGI